MPIGPFDDFAGLKSHLRSERKGKKKISDKRLNAETAAVAEKIRPGWHEEAAKKAAKTRKGY